MNSTEADALAKRMINSFRGGPPLADWVEELTPLDVGRAGTAYARLRSTLDHAPTVARFMVEYNALDTERPGSRPACNDCEGTGWISAPDRVWPDNRHSTQCKPCSYCDEGRKRAMSRTWLERRAPKPQPVEQPAELFSHDPRIGRDQ